MQMFEGKVLLSDFEMKDVVYTLLEKMQIFRKERDEMLKRAAMHGEPIHALILIAKTCDEIAQRLQNAADQIAGLRPVEEKKEHGG